MKVNKQFNCQGASILYSVLKSCVSYCPPLSLLANKQSYEVNP